MEMDSSDFVPTKASSLCKDPGKRHELSVHKNRTTKEKQPETNVKSVPEKQQIVPINMAKAKHEIIRFGIEGFDETKKKQAKLQLLIKLGAKPPRRKFRNYKQLMEQRAMEKESVQKDMKMLQLGKNTSGKSTAKGKSFNKKLKMRKAQDGILNVYGTVKKIKGTSSNKSQ